MTWKGRRTGFSRMMIRHLLDRVRDGSVANGAGSLYTIRKMECLVSPAALIRGRSHPIRFANGAGSLHAIRERERVVSPAGADSRALAPHSLRERDLARCSQRYLARCSRRRIDLCQFAARWVTLTCAGMILRDDAMTTKGPDR
jgi:hypothetical protein